MLDLSGIWFNTDGENNEITVISQCMSLISVHCYGKRNGMRYESFGFGRLSNDNQIDGGEFIITWTYTYSSQGGKKGVVHKTTIMIEAEDLLFQVKDELLTHSTKAKPDPNFGNWERGK